MEKSTKITKEEIIAFKHWFVHNNYDNWGSHKDEAVRYALNAFCQLFIRKFIDNNEVKNEKNI